MNLSFIKKAAPWIGTVVGAAVPAAAPFIGIASKLLTSGLGKQVDPNAKSISDAISEAMASPEQLAKLKEIDNDFALQMKTLDINSTEEFEKIAAADRADARLMQEKTGSKIPAMLSISVTAGFFGLLLLLVFRALPQSNMSVVNIMLGALGTAWISVMNYFFGSSAGSARKTELLSQAEPIDGKNA